MLQSFSVVFVLLVCNKVPKVPTLSTPQCYLATVSSDVETVNPRRFFFLIIITIHKRIWGTILQVSGQILTMAQLCSLSHRETHIQSANIKWVYMLFPFVYLAYNVVKNLLFVPKQWFSVIFPSSYVFFWCYYYFYWDHLSCRVARPARFYCCLFSQCSLCILSTGGILITQLKTFDVWNVYPSALLRVSSFVFRSFRRCVLPQFKQSGANLRDANTFILRYSHSCEHIQRGEKIKIK